MTEQGLGEAVFNLQRRDLAPEIRQVVDEAARLLSEGREGEARALVEKAEALVALAESENGTATKVNGVAKVNGSAGPAFRGVVAPLAAKLAAGFTEVLTNVLDDVHRYTGDQIQVVADSLQEHIRNMEAALRHASGVGERLEQLANEHHVSLQGMQQNQEELWNAVRALQQADQEKSACISRVSAATEELSHHVAIQLEGVSSRFNSLEDRVSLLERMAEDTMPQISGILGRLDRQSDSLRVLEERQHQRVATLNQVLDSLARLREPEETERVLAATA